jgi:hypothetical protein
MTQRHLLKLPQMAGIAIAALLLTSIGSIATAQEEKREVKVDVSQSKAVIESESQADNKEDELKIEFDNGSHNFNFEYESEDEDSELEAKVKVELLDLIEWRDTNGNGSYDPTVPAETVQKIGLGDLVSQSVLSTPISVADVQGVEVVGVSSAPAKYTNLTMTLKLRMFGEFLNYAGAVLEPTSMKFDIEIREFPFQRDDTSLALYARVLMEAEDEAKKVVEKQEGVVGARTGKYVSFFSWGTTVTVDGQSKAVGKTLIKHDQQSAIGEKELVRELYLLYPRGDNIVHDPKVGVGLPKAARGGGCF